MEILTKKNCSHCNFQDLHSPSQRKQVSLVRSFLTQAQKVKSADLELGWKHDPDLLQCLLAPVQAGKLGGR